MIINIVITLGVIVFTILITFAVITYREWKYNPHRVIPIRAESRLGETVLYNNRHLKKIHRKKGFILSATYRVPIHADKKWLRDYSDNVIKFHVRYEDGSIDKFHNVFHSGVRMLLIEKEIKPINPKPIIEPAYI